jgi:hypothetical protein
MRQPPVVLGSDYGGPEIAAAVRDPVSQRLASVVMPGCGEFGARSGFLHGTETARDLLRTAAPGAELAGVGVARSGIRTADDVGSGLSHRIRPSREAALGRPGSVTSADSAPEVTSTGTMA